LGVRDDLSKSHVVYSADRELYRSGEFVNFIGRVETLCYDFCALLRLRGHGEELEPHLEAVQNLGRKNAIGLEVDWGDVRWMVEEQERLVIERFYKGT
jgi:hypothetical protein